MRVLYWDALMDYPPSDDLTSVITDMATDWGFGCHAVCRAVVLPDMTVEVGTDEHDNQCWRVVSTDAAECDLTALLDMIEQGGELTSPTVVELIDEVARLRDQVKQYEYALEAIGAGGVSGRITQRRGI